MIALPRLKHTIAVGLVLVGCSRTDGDDTTQGQLTVGTTDPGTTHVEDDAGTTHGTDPDETTTPGTGSAPGTSSTAVGESDSEDGGSTGPVQDDVACPEGPFAASPFDGGLSTTPTRIPVDETGAFVTEDSVFEGPVWLGEFLLWTRYQVYDPPPPSEVFRLDPPSQTRVVFTNTGLNGLALRPDGLVLGASHALGAIVVLNPETGVITPWVTSYEGNPFNSPNDIAVRSDGHVYFTDPDYQHGNGPGQSTTRAYWVTPDGTITAFESSIYQPNGIILSPAGDTLYLGHPSGILRYAVNPDGSVQTPGTAFGNGIPSDGMGVDCAGNLYATLFNEGDIVILRPDASEITRIDVAPRLTNVAFGGPNRTTLYITAGGQSPEHGILFSLEVAIPGLPN